jgi:acyl-coenzyme A thioesterase PaaI-like protein
MLPDGWAASTIDYTLKLLAPAVGEKLVARGRVLRSGRTLSVAAADVFCVQNGKEILCATALTTIRNFETIASTRQ